jgi:hypothetical protein
MNNVRTYYEDLWNWTAFKPPSISLNFPSFKFYSIRIEYILARVCFLLLPLYDNNSRYLTLLPFTFIFPTSFKYLVFFHLFFIFTSLLMDVIPFLMVNRLPIFREIDCSTVEHRIISIREQKLMQRVKLYSLRILL